MGECFKFMFKDNKFLNKALIIFILMLISNCFVLYANTLVPIDMQSNAMPPLDFYLYLLIGSVISLLPVGYMLSCTKVLIEQQENYILPTFNFFKNFKQVFIYMVAILLATLVISLCFTLLTLILGIVSAIVNSQALAVTLITLLVLGFTLFFCYLALAFIYIFVNTGWMTSFLRFKRAWKLIKDNKSTYNKAFWLMALLMLVVGIVSNLSYLFVFINNSIIFTIILPAIISALFTAYTIFVSAFLCAKCIQPTIIEK